MVDPVEEVDLPVVETEDRILFTTVWRHKWSKVEIGRGTDYFPKGTEIISGPLKERYDEYIKQKG